MAVDDPVDLAREAIDEAGLQAADGRLADHARRLGEVDLDEPRGAREERVHRDLDAGRQHAADVLAGGRDDVEVRRRAEVDDDARRAVPLARRDGVDDPVRPDLARVVVADRDAGLRPRPDRRGAAPRSHRSARRCHSRISVGTVDERQTPSTPSESSRPFEQHAELVARALALGREPPAAPSGRRRRTGRGRSACCRRRRRAALFALRRTASSDGEAPHGHEGSVERSSARGIAFYFIETDFWNGDVDASRARRGTNGTARGHDARAGGPTRRRARGARRRCGVGRFTRALAAFRKRSASTSDEMIARARRSDPPDGIRTSRSGSRRLDATGRFRRRRRRLPLRGARAPPSLDVIAANLAEVRHVLRGDGIGYLHFPVEDRAAFHIPFARHGYERLRRPQALGLRHDPP